MSHSQLGACGKCMKIFFILLNVVYMLMGLALVGVGSWLVHSGESLDFFTGNNFFSGAALIIICGIVIFFITALGIVAAFMQIRVLLVAYILVILIVIVLEIVAGILGFVYRSQLVDTASDRAFNAVSEYTREGADGFKKGTNDAIDYIQNNFECCGWNTSEQWFESPYFMSEGRYPKSCECDNATLSTCIYDFNTEQSIYNTTCQDGVTDSIRRNVIALGGVGIAFGIVQVIPVLLGVCLCIAVHRAKNEYVQV